MSRVMGKFTTGRRLCSPRVIWLTADIDLPVIMEQAVFSFRFHTQGTQVNTELLSYARQDSVPLLFNFGCAEVNPSRSATF